MGGPQQQVAVVPRSLPAPRWSILPSETHTQVISFTLSWSTSTQEIKNLKLWPHRATTRTFCAISEKHPTNRWMLRHPSGSNLQPTLCLYNQMCIQMSQTVISPCVSHDDSAHVTGGRKKIQRWTFRDELLLLFGWFKGQRLQQEKRLYVHSQHDTHYTPLLLNSRCKHTLLHFHLSCFRCRILSETSG